MINEICRTLSPLEHYALIIVFNLIILFVNEVIRKNKNLAPQSLIELIINIILRKPIKVVQINQTGE